MSFELYVAPLTIRNPPRIEGPQPICKCCFQSGHLYRDCNHHSLGQIHDLLVRVFVAGLTNPERVTVDWPNHRSDNCQVLEDQRRLIGRLPAFTMRALLWKAKHPDLLLPNLPNGQPVFPSIRAWRIRNQELEARFGMSVEDSTNKLPSRIGIYSSAARYDLEEMIFINYEYYAKQLLRAPENLHLYQLHVTIMNAQIMAYTLNRFRRTLGGTSSDHTFTPHGLAVYTDQMIQYLTAMRDRQFVMLPPDVDLGRSESRQALENWRPPNNIHDRFHELNRNDILRNIRTPYNTIHNNMGQWANPSYLHPHFAHAHPTEMRHPEFQDSNIPDPNTDPLAGVRRHQTMVSVLDAMLPQPSILPDGTDDLNEPPALPVVQQRRTPTFNIHIQAEDSSKFPEQHHNSCAICWDDLTPETCCATNCKHTFCFGCITAAVKDERKKTETSHRRFSRYMNLNCPMCRQEIQDLKTFSNSDETEAAVITLRKELYTPLVRNPN